MKKSDIQLIVDYFITADSEFLKAMGADKRKLPDRTEWIKKLNREFEKPNEQKKIYYLIWLIDNQPTGHSNIHNIDFGKTANMHLHLWKEHSRKHGLGFELLKQTIPFYFKNFKLDLLICEPYSLNPGPNKILRKVGFKFVKEYKTTPGWINFHQSVNRYLLTKEEFHKNFN